MEPLMALLGVGVGVLGWRRWTGQGPRESWPLALRAGVSALFMLTALARLTPKRAELVRMVPPAVPAPKRWVVLSGWLEVMGVLGLWNGRSRFWAATGLSALLLGLFPANVYHARHARRLRWSQQLGPRTFIQLVFLAATGALAWHARKEGRP